jgi:hypothetical protein
VQNALHLLCQPQGQKWWILTSSAAQLLGACKEVWLPDDRERTHRGYDSGLFPRRPPHPQERPRHAGHNSIAGVSPTFLERTCTRSPTTVGDQPAKSSRSGAIAASVAVVWHCAVSGYMRTFPAQSHRVANRIHRVTNRDDKIVPVCPVFLVLERASRRYTGRRPPHESSHCRDIPGGGTERQSLTDGCSATMTTGKPCNCRLSRARSSRHPRSRDPSATVRSGPAGWGAGPR